MKTNEKIKAHITHHTSQRGITLIALIITIIVMLILVGVTINIALNGGLFEKGEKAAFQTGASTVKEQLELAKALKVMNAEGKLVEDYSEITVRKLEGLDQETINKYGNVLVVNKNGDICYNPASVTDKEKTWLEEIGIKAYVNNPGANEPPTQTEYSFTLNSLGDWGTASDSLISFSENEVWKIIGDDLTLNNEYAMIYEEGMINFAITTNDEEFKKNDYLVQAICVPEDDIFAFFVFTSTGDDFWAGDSIEERQAFLNEYGDVVFKFKPVSEIELPS